MAVTKIWPVYNRLDRLISYVANKEKTQNDDFEDLKDVIEYAENEVKTEKRLYVTGINCEPENAYRKMKEAFTLNDKPMPIVAYHSYQSFAAGEVAAKTAHDIGVKLATEIWGDKFHVVVATHLNTGHYHNHFAICSTSFVDGRRYHDDKHSKWLIRQTSDRLCREYGLSIIENPKSHSSQSYIEWYNSKNGMPTILSQMKTDVDEAVIQSMTERQFFINIEKMGYTVTLRGRHEEPLLSVTPRGYKHAWRLSRHFGDDYTYNRIMERVEGHSRQLPIPEEKPKPVRLRGEVHNFMKVTTLHGMYIHTLYQMGFLPKNNPKRIPVELREDLLKLDIIIAETRLLGQKHIDTDKQLFDFREKTELSIIKLCEERQKLRNRLRWNTNDTDISDIKEQIAPLSSQLAKLRKDVKLCDGIAERSGILKEKLKLIYEHEDSERKGLNKNEQFRRRS